MKNFTIPLEGRSIYLFYFFFSSLVCEDEKSDDGDGGGGHDIPVAVKSAE